MSAPAHALHDFMAQSYRRRKIRDRLCCGLLFVAAAAALFPLFSVMSYVMMKGVGGLSLAFFTQTAKPVGEVGGGMANALAGTLLLVAIACAIGIVWGIGTGVYLSEYGDGKLGWAVRFAADMLASVPSVVIGLFVYAMIVAQWKQFSALAGGIALGMIMIPTVARSTEEMLRLVPQHIREAGLALGLPRWKVTLMIVLKGCRGGITTGVMLAVARVAGETAPLLLTALNNRYWSFDPFQPIASLPVQIYSYAIAPFEEWHAQAWTGALVLVGVVFVLNLSARIWFGSDSAGRE